MDFHMERKRGVKVVLYNWIEDNPWINQRMAIGGELKIESPTSDSKVVKSIKYEEVLIVYRATGQDVAQEMEGK